MFDLRKSCAQLKALFIPSKAPEVVSLPDETLNKIREQRRSVRIEIELPVTVRTHDQREFQGFCRDLSREGAAAIIRGEFQVGDQIDLVLSPQVSEIRMPVIVRHSSGHRYGVEFCPTDTAERDKFLIDTCGATM